MTDEPLPGQKRCLKCQRTYPGTARICLADGEPLSLPDPYHLVTRTLADRYRLDALVGIGGMGAVAHEIGWEGLSDRPTRPSKPARPVTTTAAPRTV